MSISPSDEASSSIPSYSNERSTVNSSFMHAPTEMLIPEPELNLADFINMDDEVPSVADAGTQAPLASPPRGSPMVEDSVLPPNIQTSSPPITSPTTGISPFAAKPDSPRTSFNLAALWNAPKSESPSSPVPPPEKHEQQVPSMATNVASGEQRDVIMEPETTGADDQDFDMFLVEKDQGASPDALQAAFDALPQVWSGKVCFFTYHLLNYANYALDHNATGFNHTTRDPSCCPPTGRKTLGTLFCTLEDTLSFGSSSD
jgi:hypothetical protein